MAIDKTIFATELKGLSDWFNRPISDDAKTKIYLILNDELSTDEFKRSIIWAWKHCTSFPSPNHMIEGVKGSIKDRAILEWSNVQNLSEVGKKAFAEIGGSFAIKKSENLPFLRKEFIENFQAFARNASPSELRIKEFPKAIALPVDDRPRLRKPNPLTWTDEQQNWTYKQWEKFLNEQQNQSNATLYAAS